MPAGPKEQVPPTWTGDNRCVVHSLTGTLAGRLALRCLSRESWAWSRVIKLHDHIFMLHCLTLHLRTLISSHTEVDPRY